VTGRERKETDAMSSEPKTEMQRAEGTMPRVPEQTRPGPVYVPAVDIFETDGAITVLADMPGVKPDQLEIDLRDNVLTLTGRVATAPSGETDVLREYGAGTFLRQFTLAESIDQAKIDAKLADGVLRLELPKLERAKPRQITVRAG
jgi:HSP20 family protein